VRTYHLSNAVDTEIFSPARRDERLRRRLLGDGTCLAVYAGLHGIAQGLSQVLEAAAHVQDLPGLRFAFVGEGPEKEELIVRSRTMGLGNVRFEPPVPASEVPALIASADIALVPLRTDLPGAVPSKLYEAMASGRPVLLAANGEAARIIRESGAGTVVEPGDFAGMAAALRELTRDVDRRQAMGRMGRTAAMERFNRRLILDRFIDYIEKS
jgi:glycosyltransferase involved in cell wall biosynthesis